MAYTYPRSRLPRWCYWILGIFTLILVITTHLMMPFGGETGDRAIAAPPEEGILSYNSDITVQTDGTLIVEETIVVNATGDSIKRGIYRDFPLTSPLHSKTVSFEVLQVKRDGQPTHYWVEDLGHKKYMNISKEDVYLDPGRYTYTILYRSDDQLNFAGKNDQLYWNVTGQKWSFPIDQVTATVRLPEEIPTDSLEIEAYVGEEGEEGQSYEAIVDAEGNLVFKTTRPLEPREGLSILVNFPTGYIEQWIPIESMSSGDIIMVLLGILFSGFLFFLPFLVVALLFFFSLRPFFSLLRNSRNFDEADLNQEDIDNINKNLSVWLSQVYPEAKRKAKKRRGHSHDSSSDGGGGDGA